MKKPIRFIGWIMIIFILILGYLYYFMAYVPGREAKLFERGFRILRDYSLNIQSKEKYYLNHLYNFGRYYIMLHDTLRVDSHKLPADTGEIPGKDPDKVIREFRRNNDLNPDIHFDIVKEPVNDSMGVYIKDKTEELVYSVNYVLEQKKDRDNGRLTDHMEKVRDSLHRWNAHGSFTISSGEFFKGLKYDFVFESIVVFDRNGLIASDPYRYNLFNYDSLIHASKAAYAGIVKKDIMVYNEEKHLLILPGELLGQEIYLAGIINSSVYVKWTRNLNTELVLALVVLMVLLFSSFPLFKILFISKQERLHTRDSNLATTSLIFCTGLVVIFVQGSIRQNITRSDRMDRRLDSISVTLTDNIREDLGSLFRIHEQIVRGEDSTGKAVRELMRSVRNNGSVHVYELSDTLFPGRSNDPDLLPLPVNDILFIDSDGFSQKMLTKNYLNYKQLNTPDLGDRDYYSIVHEGRTPYLWDTVPYFIESIMAYTSGEGEAAVSFAHNEFFPQTEDTIRTEILAITSSMPSLFKQVLPSDVQFAVIDRSGNTLFHSERNRNLHENFFEEVEKTQFQSFLENNLSAKEWVSYHSRDWRAMIRPIDESFPFYLVIMIDNDRVQETNTRIILHTFLLFLVYAFFIFTGTLIINITRPRNLFLKQKQYNYVWLFYTDRKVEDYKQLIITLLILIITQLAGLFIYKGIPELLLFQFTVVSLSAFYGLHSLDRNLNQNIVSERRTGVWMILGIFILFILSLTIILSYLVFSGENAGQFVPILLILASLVFYWRGKQVALNRVKNLLEKNNVHSDILFYRIFMGCWWFLLTFIPATHMLNAVTRLNHLQWSRYDLKHMASNNIALLDDYKAVSITSVPGWFKHAQGDGLDGFRVRFDSGTPLPDKAVKVRKGKLTREFPVNLFPNIHTNLDPFLADTSFFGTAEYIGGSGIHQMVPSTANWLKISRTLQEEKMGFLKILVYIFISLLVLTALVYFNIIFLLDRLMYIDFGRWIKKLTPDWGMWLKNENYRKIILVTMNYEKYISITRSAGFTPVPINFYQLFTRVEYWSESEIIRGKRNPVIFITGLEWHIHEVSKHSMFLEKVDAFVRNARSRIVVCSPFEFDYIKKVIYDHFGGDKMPKDKQRSYLGLLGKWEAIFQRFYKFNGVLAELPDPPEQPTFDHLLERELTIAPELKDTVLSKLQGTFDPNQVLDSSRKREVEVLILGIQHLLEPKYYSIWNNCTDMEKIVLYDLADDGMVNLKNRFLINRMVASQLISRKPFPRIFSESFRNFILTSVREDEIKDLEKRVRRSGNWNSIRFFYLTIFLSIAIFLIVIQGTSIDRALAVFTAILAFFPALLKVFNNFFVDAQSMSG